MQFFSILNVSDILQTSKQYYTIRGSLFQIPWGPRSTYLCCPMIGQCSKYWPLIGQE